MGALYKDIDDIDIDIDIDIDVLYGSTEFNNSFENYHLSPSSQQD